MEGLLKFIKWEAEIEFSLPGDPAADEAIKDEL